MPLADTGPQVAFTFPESTLWKNERHSRPPSFAEYRCNLQWAAQFSGNSSARNTLAYSGTGQAHDW